MTADVRPDVAAFLAMLNAMPKINFDTVASDTMRAMNVALINLAEVERGPMAICRDVSIPGPAGEIPARLYDVRETRGETPVMVFYHGGGWVIGDLDTYGPYCAEVARQLDIPVISIGYRLAPEHRWPAAPDDCEAATRWIAGSPDELGYTVTGLVTSGDSAGGNLTIVTTMALRDKPAAVPVIAQFPIYPATSSHADWPSFETFGERYLLSMDSMRYFGRCYQGDPTSPRGTSPLDFDQNGMPPTVIMTAGLDPLLDQGRAYADALKAAGVSTVYLEAKGNIHGCFQLRKAIPSTQQDVTTALTALKTMIAEALVEVGAA